MVQNILLNCMLELSSEPDNVGRSLTAVSAPTLNNASVEKSSHNCFLRAVSRSISDAGSETAENGNDPRLNNRCRNTRGFRRTRSRSSSREGCSMRGSTN